MEHNNEIINNNNNNNKDYINQEKVNTEINSEQDDIENNNSNNTNPINSTNSICNFNEESNETIISINPKTPNEHTFSNKKKLNIKEYFINIKDSFIDFGRQFARLRVYITGIIGGLVIIAFQYLYGFIVSSGDNSNETSINNKLREKPLSQIIKVCIVAPFLEEFIFRKILFGITKKISKPLAYIISCFIFAFAHFGYNFDILFKEWITFPIYFISGAILAYVYDYDGYLLASIISHAFNNIYDIILFFLGFNL
ncbi:Abi-domain-containing protein [Neocallimastix sp. 'constans']